MKRMIAALMSLVFMAGCGIGEADLDRAMKMRETLIQSNGCAFDAKVTADYGEELYTFGLQCIVDNVGDLVFTVTEPDTITGITGTVSSDGGKIVFDDQALAFSLLAEGEVSPISAPWLLIKSLRGGYLNACTQTDKGMELIVDDSYAESNLKLIVWLDEKDLPYEAEILWDGRRVVSLQITNYRYQ